MDIANALRFVKDNATGVIATIAPDGAPHLSVVSAAVIDESVLWISLTEARVKTRNLERDPRATFLSGVAPWVAVTGPVTLRRGPGVLEDLRRYYRAIRGEHPDWDDYDRAMREDRRLIAEIRPERAYGIAG